MFSRPLLSSSDRSQRFHPIFVTSDARGGLNGGGEGRPRGHDCSRLRLGGRNCRQSLCPLSSLRMESAVERVGEFSRSRPSLRDRLPVSREPPNYRRHAEEFLNEERDKLRETRDDPHGRNAAGDAEDRLHGRPGSLVRRDRIPGPSRGIANDLEDRDGQRQNHDDSCEERCRIGDDCEDNADVRSMSHVRA